MSLRFRGPVEAGRFRDINLRKGPRPNSEGCCIGRMSSLPILCSPGPSNTSSGRFSRLPSPDVAVDPIIKTCQDKRTLENRASEPDAQVFVLSPQNRSRSAPSLPEPRSPCRGNMHAVSAKRGQATGRAAARSRSSALLRGSVSEALLGGFARTPRHNAAGLPNVLADTIGDFTSRCDVVLAQSCDASDCSSVSSRGSSRLGSLAFGMCTKRAWGA